MFQSATQFILYCKTMRFHNTPVVHIILPHLNERLCNSCLISTQPLGEGDLFVSNVFHKYMFKYIY